MMNQLLMSVLSQKNSKPKEGNYVRFVSSEARRITPKYTNSGITLQYSVNRGETWTTISSGSITTSATEHWFRGQATGTKALNTSSGSTWEFSGSSVLKVYGNLNFLLCDTLGDEVAPTSLENYCYRYMFSGCTSLTIAPELPATVVGGSCYERMFANCTALTTSPKLPATTAVSKCYYAMFSGCSSLTTAPELPATVVGGSCYERMFANCTALTTSPELPATTVQNSSYSGMFQYCTSLTIAPLILPATDLASTYATSCYERMFSNCTALTTSPKLPATTLGLKSYRWMFDGCTALTTAPELPATTLREDCYYAMFAGCTSFKVSATNTGSYTYAWRIPTSGYASTATNWNYNMLQNTGGTFTSKPSTSTTYYVENEPV